MNPELKQEILGQLYLDLSQADKEGIPPSELAKLLVEVDQSLAVQICNQVALLVVES